LEYLKALLLFWLLLLLVLLAELLWAGLASKLGIDDATIEGVTAALQGNPEMTMKLKELDLEYAKLEVADRDSARKSYAAVATSEHATKLDKSVVPILALGTVTLAFTVYCNSDVP
jgi:hypothetical protein